METVQKVTLPRLFLPSLAPGTPSPALHKVLFLSSSRGDISFRSHPLPLSQSLFRFSSQFARSSSRHSFLPSFLLLLYSLLPPSPNSILFFILFAFHFSSEYTHSVFLFPPVLVSQLSCHSFLFSSSFLSSQFSVASFFPISSLSFLSHFQFLCPRFP